MSISSPDEWFNLAYNIWQRHQYGNSVSWAFPLLLPRNSANIPQEQADLGFLSRRDYLNQVQANQPALLAEALDLRPSVISRTTRPCHRGWQRSQKELSESRKKWSTRAHARLSTHGKVTWIHSCYFRTLSFRATYQELRNYLHAINNSIRKLRGKKIKKEIHLNRWQITLKTIKFFFSKADWLICSTTLLLTAPELNHYYKRNYFLEFFYLFYLFF